MILTEKEIRTFKRIQQSDACAQYQRPIEWSDVKVLGINRAYHKAYKLVHDSFGNVDLNNNMHLELLGIGYIAHSKSRDFDRLNFKQQQIAVGLFQKGQDQALKTRQIEQNIGDLLGVVPTYGTGLKTFVTKFSADAPLLNGENIAKFDRHFFTQDYAYHMQNLHMDDTGDRLYLGRTVFNIKHELIKSTQDLSAAQLKLDDELVKLSNLTQLSKETLLEHAREYQASLQKELNTFSSTYALKMDTMSDDMKGMLSFVIHNQLQRKQEREREQEEQKQTFANNVKASQGLFEDIKVVATVFNNRKLDIVANIGQAQVKICTALSELKTTFPAIQGLLSSNGALGKALSGLSMVAPYRGSRR